MLTVDIEVIEPITLLIGKNGIPIGPKGDSYYLFIGYATDENGAGFSLTDDTLDYVSFLTKTVNVAPAAEEFLGWKSRVGKKAYDGYKEYCIENELEYLEESAFYAALATVDGKEDKGVAAGLLNTHNTSETAHSAQFAAKENIGVAQGLITQLIDSATIEGNTLKRLEDRLRAAEAIIGNVAGDDNNIIDTVRELLAVFSNFPEGSDMATLLTAKVNITDIYNALDCVIEGKTLDARQGKVLSDAITALQTVVAGKADKTYTDTELAKKVDKVEGKGLSTEDYTTAEKGKVATTLPTYEATCDTAAATVAKTATIAGLTVLLKGYYIVKFTQGNTADKPTLNINNLGAISIYFSGLEARTLALGVNALAVVTLYYDGTYFQLVGSQRTADNDTYDRMLWSAPVKAGTTLYAWKIIMQGIDGRFYPLSLEDGTGTTKTVSIVEFPINSAILLNLSGTIAENSTGSTMYSEYIFSILYTANQSSFTAYKNVYLKGTVTNGLFKLDNTSYTSWLVQDLPTTEDGFVYILLGYMYSTTGLRLIQYHPIYQFKNGVLQPYVPPAVQTIAINIVDNLTVLATGDAQKIFTVPLELNGKELLSVAGAVDTVSTSGLPTFQMRDIALAADMLSTALTIDANEYNSYTALTAAVINPTYKILYTGQRIAFDCDVAGTGTKGYTIYLKVK